MKEKVPAFVVLVDCLYPPRSRGPLVVDSWRRFTVYIGGQAVQEFDELVRRKPALVRLAAAESPVEVEVAGQLPPLTLRVDPSKAFGCFIVIAPSTQLSPNGFGERTAAAIVEYFR